MDRAKSHTVVIIKKYGFKNVEELYLVMEEIPLPLYRARGITKELFSMVIKKLVLLIEHEGGVVRDARDMTSPGAIGESVSSDYLQMRYAYLQMRKKLMAKLEVLVEIRREFDHLRDRANWTSSQARLPEYESKVVMRSSCL